MSPFETLKAKGLGRSWGRLPASLTKGTYLEELGRPGGHPQGSFKVVSQEESRMTPPRVGGWESEEANRGRLREISQLASAILGVRGSGSHAEACSDGPATATSACTSGSMRTPCHRP